MVQPVDHMTCVKWGKCKPILSLCQQWPQGHVVKLSDICPALKEYLYWGSMEAVNADLCFYCLDVSVELLVLALFKSLNQNKYAYQEFWLFCDLPDLHALPCQWIRMYWINMGATPTYWVGCQNWQPSYSSRYRFSWSHSAAEFSPEKVSIMYLFLQC